MLLLKSSRSLLLCSYAGYALLSHGAGTWAGETGSTQLSPQLTLDFEHDSNAGLSNGITAPIQSDNFLHVLPSVTLNKPYKEHLFLADFSADYRKGFLTNLSETNLGMLLSGAFQVSKKTRVILKDSYNKSSFDQSLQGVTSAFKSTTNDYSLQVKQRFARRLKASVKYHHKDKRFTGASIAKAITGKTDGINAQLFVPITYSLVSELYYGREKQKYTNRTGQDFVATDYGLKLRWEGIRRFIFWTQGGFYVLNYALPSQTDSRVFKWGVGADMNYSDNLTASLSFGKDGLANVTYEAKLDYQSEEKGLNGQLQFSKTTMKSNFSPYVAAVFTTYNRWNASLSKKFSEKYKLTMRAGYLTFDAGTGLNKTSTAGLKGVYYINDKYSAGIRYEYAQRKALLKTDEYKDNRFGVFASMVF